MARLSTPAGVELAPLTIDDVAAAAELSAAIGWNQDAQDWRRLIDLHPATVIGAWRGGRLVGSATLTVYPPDLAWLGMVITHPDARGQGIGGAVVDAVLATPEAASVPLIGLDATPAGAPIYERRGFVTVDTVERWDSGAALRAGVTGASGNAAGAEPIDVSARQDVSAREHVTSREDVGVREHGTGREDVGARDDVTARPLNAGEEATVVALDRDAAGVDRSAMLRHLLEEPGVRAWVAEDRDRAVGYAVLRPGRTHAHLGPVVADDDGVFGALLSSVVAAGTPGPVFVDAVHRDGVTARLEAAGFQVARTLGRMTRDSATRGGPTRGRMTPGGLTPDGRTGPLTGGRLKAAMALEWG